jgi:hypothetical protein
MGTGRPRSWSKGQRNLALGLMGADMSYVLLREDLATQLLLKIVMAQGRLVAPWLAVGDLVVAGAGC